MSSDFGRNADGIANFGVTSGAFGEEEPLSTAPGFGDFYRFFGLGVGVGNESTGGG